jgi:hypothetical protein
MVTSSGEVFVTRFPRFFPSLILAAAFLRCVSFAASNTAELRSAFRRPPDSSRIMMRWWWFGSAVTRPELEREMRLMKEGGMGGFEVQPVYPLELDNPARGFRNLPFLSDEFIDALRFTSQKARELGLRLDLTIGSGWPYGGPGIPITQAAGRLRCDRVPVNSGATEVNLPQIREGEAFITAFLARGDGRTFSPGGLRELNQATNGTIRLPADLSGPHVVLFFIASRTQMMVKRAAAGAEGFVLDHYDRAALDNHLKAVGERLMLAFGPHPPYAVFCDSLEVFASDWTGDLLEEFRKRRGYDLKPYLPALVGDIGEKTGAVRNDWGETLAELAEDRFLRPLAEWARRHGTLARVQDYGTPPVALSSNRLVDLPEGEQPHWRRFTSSRWASSASHLLGKPVTSSETWTWLHSPAFRATPLDMKAEADLHFLEGINQLIGHGWPYSPEIAGEPGWRFYASAVFNHHNPWWIVMPDITSYLQRVSFLLREGRPANDVAIYLPTSDARAQFTIGRISVDRAMEGLLGPRLIPQVLEAGYNFDFIDDGTIDQLEGRYAVVILPGVERIPVETLGRLEAFARKGGRVVATGRVPSLAPGLVDAAARSKEVRAISSRLSKTPVPIDQLGAELRRLRQPDVALSPAVPEIGFIHRGAGYAEIYFLANTGNKPCRREATFRVGGMQPEWWDPYTGETKPARVAARPKGGVTVAMDLEPYGSRVLVFSKDATAAKAEPRGATAPPEALDISTAWKVTFPGLKRSVEMTRLHSWTDDAATRHYSGEAIYEKTVTVSQALLRPGGTVALDFGDGRAVLGSQPESRPGMRAWFDGPVREAAVVWINGQRAGSVWRPPYSLDVTRFLRPGQNTLRIAVANTAINQLAGATLPDYKALKQRYGDRFQPQDMDNLQPVSSGLLGDIRLVRSAAP